MPSAGPRHYIATKRRLLRPALIVLAIAAGLLVGLVLATASEAVPTAPLSDWLIPRLKTIARWLGSAEATERFVSWCFIVWRTLPVALVGGLLCGPLLARGLPARPFCYATLVWPLVHDYTIWYAIDTIDRVSRIPELSLRPLPTAQLRENFLTIALGQFVLCSLFLLFTWLVARRLSRRAPAAAATPT